MAENRLASKAVLVGAESFDKMKTFIENFFGLLLRYVSNIVSWWKDLQEFDGKQSSQ